MTGESGRVGAARERPTRRIVPLPRPKPVEGKRTFSILENFLDKAAEGFLTGVDLLTLDLVALVLFAVAVRLAGVLVVFLFSFSWSSEGSSLSLS